MTFWFCLCQVPLGTYPKQRFDEPAALQFIKDFQAELSSLSVAITNRNSELELPYTYLNPKVIENSISIWDIFNIGKQAVVALLCIVLQILCICNWDCKLILKVK